MNHLVQAQRRHQQQHKTGLRSEDGQLQVQLYPV